MTSVLLLKLLMFDAVALEPTEGASGDVAGADALPAETGEVPPVVADEPPEVVEPPPRFVREGAIDLETWVTELEEGVASLDIEACEPLFQAWFDALEGIAHEDVDLAALEGSGPLLIQRLFDARVATHEWMTGAVQDGVMTETCVTAIRRGDLAGRYLQDELFLLLPSESRPVWVSRSDFRGADDFRSGDVVVSRGATLASAGIAHMGRIDSQFSHNALIYVPEKGRAKTVESYMQTGAISQSADRFLADELGRAVVIRHRDPELAARAAAAGHERVSRRPKIVYDEKFDFEDHSTLFCSEVPRWAYGELLDREETMPYAMTIFEREKNARMYDAMGIGVDITSAPSDMLYEPSFELIAEWRDVEQLRMMRLQDAVVESMMRWMEELDYGLEPLGSDRFTVGFGLFVRRIPLLGLALKKQLHPSSGKDFLVTSLALQNAAYEVLEALKERLAEGGGERRLAFRELAEELEAIRLEDLEIWRETPKKSVFHRRLHPLQDDGAE